MTKKKTEDIIEYEVTISKTKLENKIKERISNYDWTSFLQADNIDYKEFEFENDRIKIKRKPTSLTTFGQFDLFIEEKENGKTKLKFQIIPIDRLFPFGQIILIGLGILLTLTGLLIDRSTNTLLIIVIGWMFISTFMYYRLKFERYMMRRYTSLIIKDLT